MLPVKWGHIRQTGNKSYLIMDPMVNVSNLVMRLFFRLAADRAGRSLAWVKLSRYGGVNSILHIDRGTGIFEKCFSRKYLNTTVIVTTV